MANTTKAKVVGINGNMVTIQFDGSVSMNEVGLRSSPVAQLTIAGAAAVAVPRPSALRNVRRLSVLPLSLLLSICLLSFIILA